MSGGLGVCSTGLLRSSVKVLAGILVCLSAAGPASADSKQVERGRYLMTVALCHDCHSPKKLDENGMPVIGKGGTLVVDETRLLSGHPAGAPFPTWGPADMGRSVAVVANLHLTAWSGPWGVSYAANLTPDKETGMGEWTEEVFIQALRTGMHQGQPNGRGILPPMPWNLVGQMTDEDLKSVWAYLGSLPPVKNAVPLPVPPASAPAGK